MKEKVLVTGGSGFIGTNLGMRLISLGYDFINVDIKPPRHTRYRDNHISLDINDKDGFCEIINQIRPQYVIHLAARTDLDSDSIEDYKVNIDGVRNICIAVSKCSSVKRVLFASSMLVCKSGYIPENEFDYSATTAYGQSKIEGEHIVRSYQEKIPPSIIFRPTSLWGPWFGEPYSLFFDMVLNGTYFKIGPSSSTKTYGYIENAVNQIISLFFLDLKKDNGRLKYIGDFEPINIDEWADLICFVAGLPKPFNMPKLLLVSGGIVGDLLAFLGFKFPLTSFRIKNMTTDNILSRYLVENKFISEEIKTIEGIQKTLKWMRSDKVS